jgi:hypothetical protein
MAETITAFLLGTAGTATTAATTGLIGYGGSVTLGGVLSTALALGSAGLSLGGGLAQSRALQAQSQWQEFQAGQEVLRGEQEANRVRETLLRTLASNNAGRAAAGVELSGSAVDVDAEAAAAAERELAIVGNNAAARAGSARASALASRASASGALIGGIGGAAGSLFNYATRVRRIG